MIRKTANVIMALIPLVAACNLASAQQPPATTLTITSVLLLSAVGCNVGCMVISRRKLPCAVLFMVVCRLAPGQSSQPTILTVDLANFVEYRADTSDVSQYGVNPGVTPPGAVLNSHDFFVATGLADIVAVNGQPVKGLYVARARAIATNPNPSPGLAIGDVVRVAIREEVFEILDASGNPVGSIMAMGLSGGAPPPGAPAAQSGVNFAVIGGTGAFAGVRGISGSGGGQARGASMTEDPAKRRINGGGTSRRILTLYPMSAPQIIVTPNGPAVTHSADFSLVTASKPAAAGEILSLFATGLGPTQPGVDPGTAFPSGPLQTANSPIEVTVNGKAADVIAAVGYPGSVNGYQVNFRVPTDAQNGTASVQVIAAWISGSPVTFPVQ
jgi:hypothetical protein